MGEFILCSSPIYGHVAPVLTIGAELVRRGHRVRMLTGSRFADMVTAAGVEHVSIPPEADYDDRDIDAKWPERAKKEGVAKLKVDIRHFAEGVPHQHRMLAKMLAECPADAILTETAFGGTFPTLIGDRAARPPLFVLGVLPLVASSKDTAPFGLAMAPSSSFAGRLRNRILNAVLQKVVFGSSQRFYNTMLAEVGAPELPKFFMDVTVMADKVFQLTFPAFEYPRSDLAAGVQFVGPLLPPGNGRFDPPSWWGELDGRTVVHVTQGTIDNIDFERVLLPTLRALADLDVLVVATTGGKPVAELGELPPNARAAEFIPYPALLPKIDLMVTNGGYGGVQFALAHGVPLVVAGDSEDKPEIAARVAWSGTGIDLKTGTPEPAKIRAAVVEALSQQSFRDAAKSIERQAAGLSALDIVCTTMEKEASA